MSGTTETITHLFSCSPKKRWKANKMLHSRSPWIVSLEQYCISTTNYGLQQQLLFLLLVPRNCGGHCYRLKDFVKGRGFLHPFFENWKCLRSLTAVFFSKDFFSSLRHSLLIWRQTRWIKEFLKLLDLKSAALIAEAGRFKQRAIPRPLWSLGNFLDTVLDLKCTITLIRT